MPVPHTADPSALLHHVLTNHTLARLLVSNDGQPFGSSDWVRLKNIAEGNPDETKIGAFGVGFYSVFNDCDEPFVISAQETMSFYWKGNSLFTKRGRLNQDQASTETCFVLDYRNTTFPMPNLLSLCQFLCTSMTFVGLQDVELWIDDWNILSLSKKLSRPEDVKIPDGTGVVTKEKMMKVVAVSCQTGQIDAKFLNAVGWSPNKAGHKPVEASVAKQHETSNDQSSIRGLFSRLAGVTSKTSAAAKKAVKEEEATQKVIFEDLAGSSAARILVRLTKATVQAYCSKALAQELERATKKPPPKSTHITILTTPYDEEGSSFSAVSGIASNKARELFSSILPHDGRVFIGFRTAQTTGLRAHISAPSVVPTVEREHIDLSARFVCVWNMEMLRAAGIVSRIGYAFEMAALQRRLLESSSGDKERRSTAAKASSIAAALHIFESYTFRTSTPSSLVSQLLEEAFWDCNRKSVDILSTHGVLPSFQVRATSENLSFVGGIPLVPKEIIDGAPVFLEKLHIHGMIFDMTIQDIKTELDSKAIDEHQLAEFLRWAGAKSSNKELDGSALRALFNATLVNLEVPRIGFRQMNIMPLQEITSFLNQTGIPPDMPIPPTTIHFKFTQTLSREQLLSFGWEPLHLLAWLQFILDSETVKHLPKSQHATETPEFAALILQVISKHWEPLDPAFKSSIAALLSSKTIMPTKFGLRKPSEAYFPSVKLFQDLATVKGLTGVKEKFLTFLGVRKTVELSVVFQRLMAGPDRNGEPSEGKWSHVELIKYLVSVRDDIPQQEIERLKVTAICTADVGQVHDEQSVTLFKASDLYQPSDELKFLGLPVLRWHGPFKLNSAEGLFLLSLGLRKFPAVPDLVRIMMEAASSRNEPLYERTMKYLIDFHHVNDYARTDMKELLHRRFVPVTSKPFPELVTPYTCFANPKTAVMGYHVLRDNLQAHASKLAVRMDPTIDAAADNLISDPPVDAANARLIFGYLSGRIAEIDETLGGILGGSLIVPIPVTSSQPSPKSASGRYRYTSPRMCFLGDSQVYGKILDFVDFGPEANSFLMKVGSKHEPSSHELAHILAQDPTRLLDTLGQEKYLELLRKLAENQAALKSKRDLWERLKKRPCLLAYKDVSEQGETDANAARVATKEKLNDDYDVSDPEDDESFVREWSLAKASSIVVVDSVEDFTIFRSSLIAAPQEELLETFYIALDSPLLSSLVKIERRVGRPISDQSTAQELRKLLLERSRIFLHDHQSSKINRDSKWLEKHLGVQSVKSIDVRKTLPSYNASHVEKKTASVLDRNQGHIVLSVTHRPDMYEISQALVHLLLRRPKHQDAMALEMILTTDLKKLKTRGFNVDRILRQRALESRIADDKRKELMEEEDGRDQRPNRTQAANEVNSPTGGGMPGSFQEDSPVRNPNSTGTTLDFLEDFKRRFGIEELRLGAPRGGRNTRNPGDQHGQEIRPGRGDAVDPITNPEALAHSLMSAVQACRSHESSELFSRPRATEITDIKDTYCDSAEGQDVIFVGNVSSGMQVYLPRHADDRHSFINQNSEALDLFAVLLLNCGTVFELAPQTLHIFHNPVGKTIAFNQDGSIFCNFHVFVKLHLAVFGARQARMDAAVYWFVVLCHELAHNLVKNHDSAHSFFTESFVQQYFRRMVGVASQYGRTE